MALMQARRWANALRDIDDPLLDLPAVRKGVRGLLEVCKNGAHVLRRHRPAGIGSVGNALWAAVCVGCQCRQGLCSSAAAVLVGTGCRSLMQSPHPHGSRLPAAEENLDDAAAEGAVGVVVPLLKKLNGGDMKAQEQPTVRCARRCGGRRSCQRRARGG